MSDLPVLTRECNDTITKLEHQRDKALSDADFWSNAHDKLEAEVAEVERIRLQDQAKITELTLEVEKLKELNRNALADRAQVSKQLTKVREANEQLAEQCKENDALKAYCSDLKAGLRQALGTSDADYTLSVAAKLELLLERDVPISLDEVKAQAVESVIGQVPLGGNAVEGIQCYANQLREGAKDE